jgi:hypothetical protein
MLPVNVTRPDAGSNPQDVVVQISGKLNFVASDGSVSESYGAIIIYGI